MSLLSLRRRFARYCEEPTAELPAPGPFPTARRQLAATVIFVTILTVVIWLLDRGYSADAAVGAVTGAGGVAATVASRLAGTRPGNGPGTGPE
jgi:hypothetical protein